jgi:hypothetical protein
MAFPNKSALEAVLYAFRYLKGSADMCIASRIHSPDQDLKTIFNQATTPDTWRFTVDSDFAGNNEPQNKRRSQNGALATLNGGPVMWKSSVKSVAFAHPDIGESHPDTSSGAAEVYAAANATFEMLQLSYISEEMGMPIIKPMLLEMDNKTAEVFTNNTAFKTRLKHIDVRQHWVQVLRDKDIIKPQHLDTKLNTADLFTKIHDASDFIRLRDMIMVKYVPD